MAQQNSVDPGTPRSQSVQRRLTDAEIRLAVALEEIFASGRQQFDDVVKALDEKQIPRPSGATGPWTVQVLEAELKLINSSLDDAYVCRERSPSSR